MSRIDEPVDEPVDEHCRRAPAEPLRPYVAWYTGYRQRGVAPARAPRPAVALPDADLHAGRAAGRWWRTPIPASRLVSSAPCSAACIPPPALIAHDGAQSGIQVALRPLGTRTLLGLQAGELADLDVPAEAVLGGVCAELRARLLAAAGWREHFAVLDEILLRRAGLAGRRPGDPRGQLGLAAADAGGRHDARVDLAVQTGWSGRRLTSRFRTEIGLTPRPPPGSSASTGPGSC